MWSSGRPQRTVRQEEPQADPFGTCPRDSRDCYREPVSRPARVNFLRWLQLFGLVLGVAVVVMTLASRERGWSHWLVLIAGAWLVVWNLLLLVGLVKSTPLSMVDRRDDDDAEPDSGSST